MQLLDFVSAPVIVLHYSIRGWIGRVNILNFMSSKFCMVFHWLRTFFFPGTLIRGSWGNYSTFNVVKVSYTEGISFSQCDYN